MQKQWRVEVVGSAFVLAYAYVRASSKEDAVAIAYKNFGIFVGGVKRVPFFQEKHNEAESTGQG